MADRIEQLIVDLEKELSASEDNEKKEKTTRIALVKQAAQSMSDDEKREARKAFETDDDKKDAKKSNTDNDDKKDAKKSTTHDDKKDAKNSMTHDDKPKDSNDEDKEKIASLTAKVNYLTAKPIIEKMLKARESAGMKQEDLDKFGRSLYGKTITEIQQRYEDDKILFKTSNALDASDDYSDIPFNGEGKSLNASDKSLEEMLN